MEPHAFVAEVYRRMSLRHRSEQRQPSWEDVKNEPRVLQAASEVCSLLPANKSAAILDIGFGRGWFLAACLKLGYTNLAGAAPINRPPSSVPSGRSLTAPSPRAAFS